MLRVELHIDHSFTSLMVRQLSVRALASASPSMLLPKIVLSLPAMVLASPRVVLGPSMLNPSDGLEGLMGTSTGCARCESLMTDTPPGTSLYAGGASDTPDA